MEYMLLIHADPKGFDALTETQRAQGMAAYTAFTEALRKAEVLRNSNRLRPAETGTTVRIRDGKTEVLNGPFIETREQLGGYYLIDVADLDAALAWAARCPGASHGAVEVRPVWAVAVMAECGSVHGRGGRAAQLRQAGSDPRRPHRRRGGGRGRAVRSVRCGARASGRRAARRASRGVVAHRRAPAAGRFIASGSALTMTSTQHFILLEELAEPADDRARAGPPPRAAVRVRAPRYRGGGACAIDAADGARLRRRHHRLGVPRRPADDVAAARSRQDQDPPSRHRLSRPWRR